MTQSSRRILIRTDASSQIGTGHVMRCLTLAKTLRQRGADVTFWCLPLTGHLIERIQDEGFSVQTDEHPDFEALPFDWLIVDHYQLDARWESACRSFVRQIMVIDDLADRSHDCDVLLDQNYIGACKAPNQRYQGLVPESCQVLLGSDYVLLRPEFAQLRQSRTPYRNSIQQILVSLGGADPNNDTGKVLEALALVKAERQLSHAVAVDVVVGVSCPHRVTIQAQCTQYGFHYLENICDMAERMSRSDLLIGAGGTTTWERMALGLPAVVLSIADNQTLHTQMLAEDGYHVYAGQTQDVSVEQLACVITETLTHPERLHQMAEKGIQCIDAQGVNRVCDVLLTTHVTT